MNAPAVVRMPETTASTLKRANELYNAGNLEKAGALIEEYLLGNPDDAQALTVASAILKKAKRLPIAYQLARRACDLRPDRPEPWNALGHCAQMLWRMEEATSSYRKALQRAKDAKQHALFLNNAASVHIDEGRFAKAEPLLRESLKLDAADKMARHNLGLVLMAQRQWREGWLYYSASIGTESRRNQKYLPEPEPTWDGTPGKSIVIYGEQGLGDEICAASMVPDAIRDSKRVILDCDHRIANLFRRSFPATTVHGTRWEKQLAWPDEDRKIDASIAGFELGQFYRNETADFPGTPYLTPCPDRVSMWREFFRLKGKPVIGIAWTGGTWHNAGLYRQLPLSEWRPIFDALDAHWVSLQYKDARKDIEGTPVTQYPWATLTKDYDDTAALVAACDVVVAVQTTVVHLAGALGVPTLSLVPSTSQWRYGESYTDLPWYRSVTLTRPERGKPFASVMPAAIEWLRSRLC